MPKKRKHPDYHDLLIDQLKKSPREAAYYLSASLEEKDPTLFLIALRNVAEAFGGLSDLSKKTKLNRESLYRMLSKKGNPELYSLNTILNVLGFKITIAVEKKKRIAA